MKKVFLIIAVFLVTSALASERKEVKAIPTVTYGIKEFKVAYIPFKREVNKNAKIMTPFKRF